MLIKDQEIKGTLPKSLLLQAKDVWNVRIINPRSMIFFFFFSIYHTGRRVESSKKLGAERCIWGWCGRRILVLYKYILTILSNLIPLLRLILKKNKTTKWKQTNEQNIHTNKAKVSSLLGGTRSKVLPFSKSIVKNCPTICF